MKFPKELENFYGENRDCSGISSCFVSQRILAKANYRGISVFQVPDDCDLVVSGIRADAQAALPGTELKGSVYLNIADKRSGKLFFGQRYGDLGVPIELFSAGIKRKGWHFRDTYELNHWQERRSAIEFIVENGNDFDVICKAVLDCTALYRSQNQLLEK